MWNPFKGDEQKRMAKEQKQVADYQAGLELSASAQEQAIDEQDLLARRQLLVEVTQWQQDRDPTMRKLFLKLCGYRYDEDKKHIKPIRWDTGFVSLLGAQKLVSFIETLDRNVMLANWSDTVLIRTLREAIAHPLRRFMFDNHGQLGLQIQHAEYCFWLIMNTVEPTYWRGWNDGERRKDREIIKINELRNQHMQQKRRNIFGLEA